MFSCIARELGRQGKVVKWENEMDAEGEDKYRSSIFLYDGTLFTRYVCNTYYINGYKLSQDAFIEKLSEAIKRPMPELWLRFAPL